MDCQPGKSPEHLKDGGTVPVEQTSSTIPVDLVNDIMRRPYRERFRLLITELGTGLAGRPDDLQEVLQARASGPPRDLPRAPDPRQPERGHQELHHRLGHGRERAREEQEGRGRAGSRRRATPRRSRRPAARRCGPSSSASRPSSTSSARPWRGSASWPTSRRPLLADLRARRARPEHLLHPARPVRRGEPPGRPLARPDGRGGHEGVQQRQAGDRRAEQARR